MQREGQLHSVGCAALPLEIDRGIAANLQLDALSAEGIGAFEVQGVAASDDQGVVIGGYRCPAVWMGHGEGELRPLPGIEAPEAANLAGDLRSVQQGERIPEEESALDGVTHERDVKGSGCVRLVAAYGLDVQHERGGHGGGKDQR